MGDGRSYAPCTGATGSRCVRLACHALQTVWQREATEAFQTEYARRAGIEGTISRETRSMRLWRTRYIGLRRVHLGYILAAGALNISRLGEALFEIARVKTRITPSARLMADAV
jgi:transposase